MAGWIKLYRSLQEHWLWKDKEPFDKRSAWIDLLMLANHEDVKVFFNGRIVTCERGTISRSISSLADRWKWNRKKVSKFLDVLESDKMITTNRTTEGTTISIVKYEDFQVCGTTNGTAKGTSLGQPMDTNKNEKNVKNIKNVIYSRNKFNQFESQAYDMDAIERSLDL